jgi:hypothetical protein
MSKPATAICQAASTSDLKYIATASGFVKKTCNPKSYVEAKEISAQVAMGTSALSGACKYALEYEADGMPAINPYVDFLPADKSFYTYSGSLTTYPCSEGVTWLVFEQPMLVSENDIVKIMASSVCEPHTITKYLSDVDGETLAHADNRPLQKLGSRKLTKYDHAAAMEDAHRPGESPVSIAAIVIGCAGLVAAGVAVGLLLARPTSSPVKPIADDKLPSQSATIVATA